MTLHNVRTARVAVAAIAATVIGGASAMAQPLAFSGPQHHPYAQPQSFAQPQATSPRGAMPGERTEPMTRSPVHMPEHLQRQVVDYTPRREPAGTIIVDTANTYLYLVVGENRALRYGIGVGREGFAWSGAERVARKAEWPDWHPPASMIQRQPYLPRFMAGGEGNPMGARALYLGNSLYRIHGTNEPHTIGSKVSSGCIRMLNEDVMDLYERVNIGARVVVLPDGPRTAPDAVAARTAPAANEPARQMAPQQRPTQIGATQFSTHSNWRSRVY